MVANLGIGVVVLFSLFFITGSAFSGRTGASTQSSRLQTKLRKRGFASLVRVKSQATKRQTVELRNLGFETARCTSSRILGWHTTPGRSWHCDKRPAHVGLKPSLHGLLSFQSKKRKSAIPKPTESVPLGYSKLLSMYTANRHHPASAIFGIIIGFLTCSQRLCLSLAAARQGLQFSAKRFNNMGRASRRAIRSSRFSSTTARNSKASSATACEPTSNILEFQHSVMSTPACAAKCSVPCIGTEESA